MVAFVSCVFIYRTYCINKKLILWPMDYIFLYNSINGLYRHPAQVLFILEIINGFIIKNDYNY